MGFLGKAAAVKYLRTVVIRQRCKSKMRLQAMLGKSGGKGRGVLTIGIVPGFPCTVTSAVIRSFAPVHRYSQTCVSDTAQCTRLSFHLQPSSLPTVYPASGWVSGHGPRLSSFLLSCVAAQTAAASAATCGRLGTSPSEPRTVTLGMLSGACRLGARRSHPNSASAPPYLPCPTLSFPQRGRVRLPPPLGLPRHSGSPRGGGGGGQSGGR